MVTGNNTMFEAIPGEMVIEIEIERLRDFHGHPFMVRDDDQMKSLKESIESDTFNRKASTGCILRR